MGSKPRIGIVTPQSTNRVPPEAARMYPDIEFVPRGVGVKALTPEGYDGAWDGIVPAAEELAKEGVDAVMVLGTSLTFYRGYAAHEALLDEVRRVTGGLPVSTMSQAVVDGLKSVGAKQIGVCTAYADVVNKRLQGFLVASGFDVLELEGFGLEGFGDPGKKTEQDIVDLAGRVTSKAPAAEGLLISCGGLRTLDVGKQIEDKFGVPVVSSTPAAFWAAAKLVGESGKVAGFGKLLG